MAGVAQQQAAPAIDPEMPQRHQPAGAVGGDDAGRLRRQQAGQDHQRRRRQMPRHRRRQLPQRIGEDVGQHQVERAVLRELRRFESGGLDHLHQIA